MRRFVFAVLLGLLVLAFVELTSWITYSVMDGRLFTPGRAQETRDELVVTSRAPSDSLQLELMGQENRRAAPRWLREDALHPYLGFVKDPDGGAAADIREKTGESINRYGFVSEKTFLPKPGEDTFIVGIFGGSVAFQFCHKGKDAFIAELQKHPSLADKQIKLVRAALGGYKQPQQLMALNYFLVLGAHFDLVVNLDGVNEVALAWRGYRERDVHPVYPRDWALRVLDTPDPNLQQAAGEISFLIRSRSDLALAYGRAPARFSPTWNLVWKLRDGRAQKSLYDARLRYGSYRTPMEDFTAQGPPSRYRNEGEVLRDLADFWRRSSAQMHRVCEGAGIPYHHFLQPSPHVAGSKPSMNRREQRTVARGNVEFKEHVAAGYRLLQARGKELAQAGVAFHDMTQVFQNVERLVYIDGCCHMNEPGNEILARRMAEFIRAEL